MQLDIEFSDAHVRAVAHASAAPEKQQIGAAGKPRGRRGGGDSGQGSLFGG
jgi:hypothetical protein